MHSTERVTRRIAQHLGPASGGSATSPTIFCRCWRRSPGVPATVRAFGPSSVRRPACFVPSVATHPITGAEIPKGIYIAERVLHNGEWVLHNRVDVLFNTFHETGHALNATLGTDLISNTKAFGAVFDKVWSNIDKSSSTVKAIEGLGTKELIKDEVFADTFGHLNAMPHPNNEYSNDIRRLFRPVYEYMKGEGKKW